MPNRVQRTCDKTVVVLMVLLLLMGLVTLFSATFTESGDRRRACRRQKAADRRGARRCGLRDAFTRAVSRFSASQSDAAFVGNERFAADSGDYSGRGREHQRFAKMAEFFRAEHAAV